MLAKKLNLLGTVLLASFQVLLGCPFNPRIPKEWIADGNLMKNNEVAQRSCGHFSSSSKPLQWFQFENAGILLPWSTVAILSTWLFLARFSVFLFEEKLTNIIIFFIQSLATSFHSRRRGCVLGTSCELLGNRLTFQLPSCWQFHKFEIKNIVMSVSVFSNKNVETWQETTKSSK